MVGSDGVVSPAHTETRLSAMDVVVPEIWMFLSLTTWALHLRKLTNFHPVTKQECRRAAEPDWSPVAFSDQD